MRWKDPGSGALPLLVGPGSAPPPVRPQGSHNNNRVRVGLQGTNSNSFVQVLYLSFLVRHYCVCEQSWQTDTCGGDHSATVCDPGMRTVNTGVECGAWDDWYYYR